MISIYDNDTLAAALAQTIAPDLAQIVRDRWNDAKDLGLADLTHILLVQPGDEEAEIEQEIGFRPTINPIDGAAFGAREFSPYWSGLEDVGPAFELIHTVGTDFAYIILAEKAEGVPKALLDMCAEYSTDGAS